jgi:hypothetical protein
MPIVAPLNTSHTVCQNIGAIGFIPTDYIAVLLGELAEM